MAVKVIGTPDFKAGLLNPLFKVAGLSYLGARRRKGLQGEQWVLVYESGVSDKKQKLSPAEVAYNLCPTAFGYVAEIEAVGSTHRLTITTPDNPADGTGGLVVPQYELLGNLNQHDLREHPRALALGPSNLKIINGLLRGDANSDGSPKYSEAQIDAMPPDGRTIYDLLVQRDGNSTFYKSQYVFRYTAVVNPRSTLISVIYANAERIYNTAQMLAETGPPSGILASVETAVTDSRPATVAAGYFFGWLKMNPTVTSEANFKIRISGEYNLDIWSTFIYRTKA